MKTKIGSEMALLRMNRRHVAQVSKPAVSQVSKPACASKSQARKTTSGTTSVLIEPWRKKFKSWRDQVGTWAISLAADFWL